MTTQGIAHMLSKKLKHSGMQTMQHDKKTSLLNGPMTAGLVTTLLLSFTLPVNAEEDSAVLTPPAYPLTDKHGVNVIGPGLSVSQNDVSIGTGDLSLSHSIATFSGYFYGYADNFGNAYVKTLTRDYRPTWTSVALGRDQYDYKIVVVGSTTYEFAIDPDTQKYTPIFSKNNNLSGDATTDKFKTGDPKVTLEDLGEDYWLVLADGTEMRFTKGQYANYEAVLTRMTYPNGFTKSIERRQGRVHSVFTNNGLQLKYNYTQDKSPSGTLIWDASYPASIMALNNSIEVCDTTENMCTPNSGWPTVRYSWPATMANDFRSPGRKIFRVTDAKGLTTEYEHTGLNNYDGTPKEDTEAPLWHTRLTEIRYPNGDKKTYNYQNRDDSDVSYYGALSTVTHGTASWEYNEPGGSVTGIEFFFDGSEVESIGGASTARAYTPSGYKAIQEVKTSSRFSDGIPMVYSVKASDGTEAYFYPMHSRLLDHVIYPEGNRTEYTYDNNHNLTEVKKIPRPGSSEPTITQTQTFPAGECTNRKTCYQPVAITDGRGHTTEFTYHPESGQIATVTQPADNNNVRPQTRHRYEQKYAWYKNENGTMEKADTPIWLLTETSTCMTGAPTNYNDVNSGCRQANDEVLTQYDYGPENQANNLWLRGVKVIHGDESRLTCYEYNKLGIQTRVIPPKGNVGKHSCE